MNPPTPSNRPSRKPLLYALYLNAALLLLILLNQFLRPRSADFALAQYQPSIGGGAGVFLVPAQFSRDTFGCYLLDIDAQTLAVYRFDPGQNILKLAAARSFRYDRKLGNFNVGTPTPDEVKQLLDQELRGSRAPTPTTEPTR